MPHKTSLRKISQRQTSLQRTGLAALLALAAFALEARPLAALPFEPVRVGAGTLRMYGFHLYDSSLWAPVKQWRADAPYALELVYARNFKGADIARRSLDKIRKQRPLDAVTAKQWQAALAAVFPDVRAGTRLTGVRLPGDGMQFFDGDKLIGHIKDEALANAFFSIWLDPKTSEPKLRKKLLGQP